MKVILSTFDKTIYYSVIFISDKAEREKKNKSFRAELIDKIRKAEALYIDFTG